MVHVPLNVFHSDCTALRFACQLWGPGGVHMAKGIQLRLLGPWYQDPLGWYLCQQSTSLLT